MNKREARAAVWAEVLEFLSGYMPYDTHEPHEDPEKMEVARKDLIDQVLRRLNRLER